MSNNNINNKHFYNFESVTIKGNIGSDVYLKTKNKERIEFQVAVNKYDKRTNTATPKWFQVIAFGENLISTIKQNPQYKMGSPQDPYSYNGALQSKGTNFRPLTADFSMFTK